MSLLMRALEKATKERTGERVQGRDPDAGAAHRELSLEPVFSTRSTTHTTDSIAVEKDTQWDLHDAHSETAAVAARSWHIRPLAAFIVLALLFAAGYGYYLYRELNGLNAPPAPKIAKSPAPQPIFAPASEPVRESVALPQALPTAAVVERSAPAARLTSKSEAAPSSSREHSAPAPSAQTEPVAPPTAPAPPPKRIAPPAPAAGQPLQQTITVTRGGGKVATVNPALTQAYTALQAGEYDHARHLYSELERTEPRNVDVLLGLAALAAHDGKPSEAAAHYMQVIEVDPRNAVAQAGLLSVVGREDALTAESRLKRLIEREPSGFLYFTLGNVYAEQSQWAPAQQAFFRAHHLEPGNADYAYNLAVALEHLGQRRIAVGFYRQAIELARQTGRANFNIAHAEERLNKLAAPSD